MEHLRLYILDLSGYTRFLVNTDLNHGKETISEILDALYRFAPEDIILNKVEGDALFFYSKKLTRKNLEELSERISEHFNKVILQDISKRHGKCPYTLCAHITDLKIKFFIHEGTVVFHDLGEFKELMGKSVIEIHRIMKNSVKNDSYILTIDEAGKYSERYMHLGVINYDLVNLEEGPISISLMSKIFRQFRNV